MYLHEIYIKNGGPLRTLHVQLTFTDGDQPIPHIFVGRNGSGKTNLLSIIAESLMQGASYAYDDIIKSEALGRKYFRILGGKTVTYGEKEGLAVLRFRHEVTDMFFCEHAGKMTTTQAAQLVPATLRAGVNWTADGQGKNFDIDKEKATEAFSRGVFAYFPSSRSEIPSWLNTGALLSDDFDLADRFAQQSKRPIYVEHALDNFAQWLLSVITESRMPVTQAKYAEGDNNRVVVEVDTTTYSDSQRALYCANTILQYVIGDPEAEFHWAGRHQARKIGVAIDDKPIASGLDSLSGGQATLLAMFGTILQYADATGYGPGAVPGVVVIDELDAHMHIDLQLSALPQLIKYFPKIQFILTTHSPFFLLGMEREFEGNIRVLDLPDGTPVTVQAHEELDHALDALRDTQIFSKEISERLAAAESPIIWVGGETDLIYFRKAAQLLGHRHLVDYFEWVGETSASGSGTNTGDPGLNSTFKILKANPKLTSRRIVFLYDSDANKPDEEFGNVHVLSLDKFPDAYCDKGIENLLPDDAFSDDMYQRIEKPGSYGKPTVLYELRKMQLCLSLCGDDAAAETFENFRPTLERISYLLPPDNQGDSTSQSDSGEPQRS